MSLSDVQFSPNSDDSGSRSSPKRTKSISGESDGSLLTSNTDYKAKLKEEDEKRLKTSTVRALPWFINLIIFLIQLSIFVGFTFFAYVTSTIKNDQCYANSQSDEPVPHTMEYLSSINVGERFIRIIRFGFWIAVLEIIRQILAQIAYYRQSYKLLYPAFILQSVNCTFTIICFTFMQLFRLDHAGRVCSGDYLTSKEKDKKEDDYLITEGKFLFIIIMAVYGLMAMSCISICTIALCLSAKKTEEEVQQNRSAGQTPLTGESHMY